MSRIWSWSSASSVCHELCYGVSHLSWSWSWGCSCGRSWGRSWSLSWGPRWGRFPSKHLSVQMSQIETLKSQKSPFVPKSKSCQGSFKILLTCLYFSWALRVTEERKWKNAAAGDTFAAATAGAKDPRDQFCLPLAPGRVLQLLLHLHQIALKILFESIYHNSSSIFTKLLRQFGDTALPCTDDSDCITLGWKYGCFLYRWHWWQINICSMHRAVQHCPFKGIEGHFFHSRPH